MEFVELTLRYFPVLGLFLDKTVKGVNIIKGKKVVFYGKGYYEGIASCVVKSC